MARASHFCPRPKVLCLPPATGNLPAVGGIIFGQVSPPIPKSIEHAGHAYQELLKGISSSPNRGKPENSPSKPLAKTPDEPRSHKSQDNEDTARSLKSKLHLDAYDLYELLELEDERWQASADDIKKSFRRISLLYHPDKVAHLGEDARADAESHFKKVMKAYDILSDKKKRASYDSIDDVVDDSLPSERDLDDSNFYEIMGDCFALNARWSVSDHVPVLGNDSTPIEEVNKFYDFWYSFRTWRDFSFDPEYNIDQAECREEKRWMERQNAKNNKQRKLEESARLRRLVDLGYRNDPRIRREKEAVKARKEALKEARRKEREEAEEKKRLEEEKARLLEEEKASHEKEKRVAAKKEKEAAKQLLRKARQKLRAISRELGAFENESAYLAIEQICQEGNSSSIETVANELKQLWENAKSAEDNGSQSKVAPAAIEEIVRRVLSSVRISKESGRDDEETANSTPGPSTAQDGRNAGVSVTHGTESDKPGNQTRDPQIVGQVPWTQQEMSALSKALSRFPGGSANRWERISEYVGTKSPQEVLAKVNSVRQTKLTNARTLNGVSSTAKSPNVNGVGESGGIQSPKRSSEPLNDHPPAKSASMSTENPAKPPNKLVFTPRQQMQLESAMRKYPASLGAARWAKIANEVNGRSAGECEERYKELIMYYRARRNSNA